ncbi:MAG: hypothetical protein GQ546_07205 [Gammaproteobacteria bacterium]|nr:hypothetical protein [Gammaproteobacteria bacterium]
MNIRNSTLKERIRLLMLRDKLSYRRLADIAEVTEQAVYKWLTSGNISDQTALRLSEKFAVDWIWLKHGITRIDLDLLRELINSSLTSAAVFNSSSLAVVAAGKKCLEILETDEDEAFENPYYGYFTDCDEKFHRNGIAIMSKVCGWAEVIARQRLIRVSGDETALIATGKLITTDFNGDTYSLFSTARAIPNGFENTTLGVRLKLKSGMKPELDDLHELIKLYPGREYLERYL